eukprot:UN02810
MYLLLIKKLDNLSSFPSLITNKIIDTAAASSSDNKETNKDNNNTPHSKTSNLKITASYNYIIYDIIFNLFIQLKEFYIQQLKQQNDKHHQQLMALENITLTASNMNNLEEIKKCVLQIVTIVYGWNNNDNNVILQYRIDDNMKKVLNRYQPFY